MNHLIAGAIALGDHADKFGVEPSKELTVSAKNTVNNYDNSWRYADVFILLSVYIYTLILVLFVVAGLPFSCISKKYDNLHLLDGTTGCCNRCIHL